MKLWEIIEVRQLCFMYYVYSETARRTLTLASLFVLKSCLSGLLFPSVEVGAFSKYGFRIFYFSLSINFVLYDPIYRRFSLLFCRSHRRIAVDHIRLRIVTFWSHDSEWVVRYNHPKFNFLFIKIQHLGIQIEGQDRIDSAVLFLFLIMSKNFVYVETLFGSQIFNA